MRILAIYKYYWPDTTPYARILKAILERWAAAGHTVRVITAQPGYNDLVHPLQPARETIGGVQIERVPTLREVKGSLVRRLGSFLSFLSQAVLRAGRGGRPDLIIVQSHPPVLMGLAVRLLRRLRGIPYLYHCVDIQPESTRLTGQLRSEALYRLLRGLDRATCRRAALIVTLSPDMQATLVERGVSASQIEVINNFVFSNGSDGAAHSALRETLGIAGNDFAVLFAGNLGRFQGLEHVIESARLLRDETGIKFLFMGEGAAKAGLEAAAGELVGRTVFFCPYQPLAVAMRAMEEADLNLVSLGRQVYRVAYPSKTMMCLAAGSPVLTIVERNSRLASDIVDNDLGYCCEQGDHEATARAIRDARDRRDYWRERRPEIARFARQTFGRDAVLERWDSIPERVAGGRECRP